MILTGNELLQFVTGAPYSAAKEGVLLPIRMPEGMRAIHAEGEGSRLRAASPAGVRLRFRTNSRHALIKLEFGGAARSYFTSSLVLDDETYVSFGPIDHMLEWEGAMPIPADGQMRRMDLWLPHMCETRVVSIELDDGCEAAPLNPPSLRWLVYGDSISQGMTATMPLLTWYSRCARKLNAEVVNTAVGGAILDPRLAESPVEGPFDVITVLFGANDKGRNISVDAFRERAEGLMRAVESAHPDAPVLLLTPITSLSDDEPNNAGGSRSRFAECLADVADSFQQVTLVQGTDLIPANKGLFADGSHPSDSGNAALAENLLPLMKKAIGI